MKRKSNYSIYFLKEVCIISNSKYCRLSSSSFWKTPARFPCAGFTALFVAKCCRSMHSPSDLSRISGCHLESLLQSKNWTKGRKLLQAVHTRLSFVHWRSTTKHQWQTNHFPLLRLRSNIRCRALNMSVTRSLTVISLQGKVSIVSGHV